MSRKRIVCTVTNDLNYDQRMIRICTTLSNQDYDVLLVGRESRKSLPLTSRSFRQYRLKGWFNKGPFFYLEYNFRLFLFLIQLRLDIIYAVDLDTILPCLWVSQIRKKQRLYDAHELFCEILYISAGNGSNNTPFRSLSLATL
jgi:hypothetical protein